MSIMVVILCTCKVVLATPDERRIYVKYASCNAFISHKDVS
jgi:hypothetical protein